jgi:hypothetical protein
MNRFSAPVAPLSWTYHLQIGCLQLDRLLVLLQSLLIMASKCISKLTRSRLPIASPNLLDCGLHEHLQSCSITASNCISKLTGLRPPSASPNSLDRGLQVHLQTRSIMASESIREFSRSSCSSESVYFACRWVHLRYSCISNVYV